MAWLANARIPAIDDTFTMLPPSLIFGSRVCVTLKTAFKLTLSVLRRKGKILTILGKMKIFNKRTIVNGFLKQNPGFFSRPVFLTRQSPFRCIHQSAYKRLHLHYLLIRQFLYFAGLAWADLLHCSSCSNQFEWFSLLGMFSSNRSGARSIDLWRKQLHPCHLNARINLGRSLCDVTIENKIL